MSKKPKLKKTLAAFTNDIYYYWERNKSQARYFNNLALLVFEGCFRYDYGNTTDPNCKTKGFRHQAFYSIDWRIKEVLKRLKAAKRSRRGNRDHQGRRDQRQLVCLRAARIRLRDMADEYDNRPNSD